MVSLPAKDHRAWFRRHKVIVAAASVMLLGVLLGVAGGASGTEAAAVPTVAPLGSVAPSVARRGSAAAVTRPDDEKAFVEVVSTARVDYLATTNELRQHLIMKRREHEACHEVLGRHVRNWHGTITRLKTSGSEDEAILEIEIGTDIKVSNDNPGATLITTTSPMYEPLSKRGVGELIHFSGRFVSDGDCPLAEGGWSDSQKMTSPSFSFDFSAVCLEPTCKEGR